MKNRRVLIPVAIVLVLLIIFGVGSYLLYNNYNYYSTDDALVTGNIVNIAPTAAGTLTSLDVQVGDPVSAGQSIGTVKTDTQPFFVIHLRAPFTGVIVQVPGVVGQTASTTAAVAQETDLKTVKVTAYVDESAIKNISVGQAVDIHVDAYSGVDFTGHVNQIVSAAAGQFSLLPTSDNSSGNFTKVSQRIAVNIHLDDSTGPQLLPGMSTVVTIHLH
jgi:multidrug resistance efflux pump